MQHAVRAEIRSVDCLRSSSFCISFWKFYCFLITYIAMLCRGYNAQINEAILWSCKQSCLKLYILPTVCDNSIQSRNKLFFHWS